MTRIDIENRVRSLGPWYHSIKLPEGVVTPGEPYDKLWDNTRSARDFIQYPGKSVLDIASFDGMWAFEAEALGASSVVATDCNYDPIQRFLLCRQLLDSKVTPFYNVPVQKLVDRLDVYWQGINVGWSKVAKKKVPITFDIVQHCGLLYHLVDPLVSLFQARSMMHVGSKLLLETGYWFRSNEPALYFNNISRPRIYEDETTWWAPTLSCLDEMLAAALFQPVKESIRTYEGRVALVATAVDPSAVPVHHARELLHHYRTPGYTPVENT